MIGDLFTDSIVLSNDVVWEIVNRDDNKNIEIKNDNTK